MDYFVNSVAIREEAMPVRTPNEILMLEMSRYMASMNVSLYTLMPPFIKLMPSVSLRQIVNLAIKELGCRAKLEQQLSHQPPGGASAPRKTHGGRKSMNKVAQQTTKAAAKGPGNVFKRPAARRRQY